MGAEMIRSIWDQNQDLMRAAYLEENMPQDGDLIFGRDRQEVYDTVLATFAEFDTDQNGTLDMAEFQDCLAQTNLMGRPLNNKELAAVVAAVDEDKDGRISYEEFLNLVLDIMQFYWQEEQYGASQQ